MIHVLHMLLYIILQAHWQQNIMDYVEYEEPRKNPHIRGDDLRSA